MRNRSKLVLAVLAATALFALAVGNASARTFSTSERNFELIWNSALTGKTKLEFRSGAGTISCNVTLLGRFNASSIAKEREIAQGRISHGELESCGGGGATIRTETMPWELRYVSFAGRLPSEITGITTNLIRASFRVEPTGSGLACEPVTEATHPGVGIIESFSAGAVENIRADETREIPLGGRNFFCQFGGASFFAGRGLIRNLPRTAKITVTLI